MTPLILHTHLKGQRNTYREHATWKWFDRYEKDLDALNIDIAHVEINPGPGHEYEYDKVIRHFWGQDDMLLFERDLVPASFQQVVDIFRCPEDVCAIDYPLIRCWVVELVSRSGKVLTRRGPPLSSAIVCCSHMTQNSMMRNDVPTDNGERKCVWSDGTWTHADMAPLGLTRLKKSLMERLPPMWPRTTWMELDGILTGVLYLSKVRTHVHLPMAEHMRKKVSRTNHDIVAVPPPTLPGCFAADLKTEYYRAAMARFNAGMVHADRPRVEVP